ncbi:MAG: hypothetical protein EOM14_12825, partial [Clostridia bacterium]|nr:hypothetical protein [Clostridia bacterium]
DHGCEYMTGGKVAVMGRTGRNFAAGMSGGVAYVLDVGHNLYLRVNKTLVTIEPLSESHDIAELREMLSEHAEATGSPRAKALLLNFESHVGEFKKIVPRDYSAVAERIARLEAKGLSRDEAELAAFVERGE